MLRIIFFLGWICNCYSLTDLPGDGKPFGYNDRPIEHIPIEPHDISPKDFFEKYVFEHKAVLLKGAVKNTPAVEKWSDKYFLNIPNEKIPVNHSVLVEDKKKENRDAPSTNIPFKAFVEVYNHTDQYLVESVPDFLKPDVHLPFAIQCEQILTKAAVDTVMWFSSGGTKSVVHTDPVDNLNCLIRGEKTFIFVPPQFKDMVPMDHREETYSGIDVDAVDYSKYPGLAEVEYQYVDMVPGDCVFIPYSWIHQVRSFNRNIAINLWWDTSKNQDLNLDSCNKEFDSEISLENFKARGFESIDFSPAIIKDLLLELVSVPSPTALSQELFMIEMMTSVFDDIDEDKKRYFQLPSAEYLKTAFSLIDKTGDVELTLQDLEALTNDDWLAITGNLDKFKEMAEKEADEIFGSEEERKEEEGKPEEKSTEDQSAENVNSEIKDEL